MSLANDKNVKKYIADGTVGPYAYDFRIDADTDLQVIETDTVTGVDLVKTINTHYTVSGVGGAGGGNVTFTSVGVAPALGKRLTLARVVTATQGVDIPLNGPIPSNAVELMLDKLTFLAQQQNRSLAHALQTPITDPNPPASLAAKEIRANKSLAFDSNGDPTYIATSVPGTTPVAAFPATILDDLSADAVIKTIMDSMTAETIIASGDLFPIFDVSANAARKITLENIYKGLNVLTEDTTPVHNTDFVLEFDVSAGTVKKAKFSNFLANSRVTTTLSTASGTSVSMSSIPAGVTRITLHFSALSFDGADAIIIQLGDSGGLETTGYLGAVTALTNAAAVAVANLSSGFSIGAIAAADLAYGRVALQLVDTTTNLWSCSAILGASATAKTWYCAGQKALSGVLDRFTITRSGAQNFDGGTVYVVIEF